MSLMTVERDDYTVVEESHLDRWRVFNGQDWTHGFDDKQKAIEFAKRNGGNRVAFCKKFDGKVVYVSPMRVD